MGLIRFALRRPITIMVAVIAIALSCALAVIRMPVDIFPSLNLPVIYVAQPYGGMDPGQMEGLLTNYYEYHFLYISGIHHVESKNVQGTALMKLFFHPGTDMAQSGAHIAAQPAATTQAASLLPLTIKTVNITGVANNALELVANATTAGGMNIQIPLTLTNTTPNAATPILNLHVGEIHLDLLGLKVDTSEICLAITAQPGSGNLLGNLLGNVAHLLDQGAQPQSNPGYPKSIATEHPHQWVKRLAQRRPRSDWLAYQCGQQRRLGHFDGHDANLAFVAGPSRFESARIASPSGQLQ